MIIDVICGVIWNHHRIFCARKKKGSTNAGLWELPGGKLEMGETHEACLRRELQEELNLSIEVGPKLGSCEFKDSVKTIHLIAYHAQALRPSSPKASEDESAQNSDMPFDFRLVDHDQWVWMEVWKLGSLQWAPADVPLIQGLMALPLKNPFEGQDDNPVSI